MAVYLTPGPTELYPGMREFMLEALDRRIPSTSHRGADFQSIFAGTEANLRKVLGIPDNFHVFFLSAATEAMERIVEGCSLEHTFHFAAGSFAEKFVEVSSLLGRKVSVERAAPGVSPAVGEVNIPKESELVCVTQNETSMGTQIPLGAIAKLRAQMPSAIIAVDVVSSVPYVKLDFAHFDCLFFSVQKGFGLPAGLGVLMVNERAIAKATKIQGSGRSIGSYHSLLELLEMARIHETPATPNVLGIYLLGRVAEAMLKRGIDNIRRETEAKAEKLYQAFSRLDRLELFVKDLSHRSLTMIVLSVKGRGAELRKYLAEKGLVVGSGYGKFKDEHVRIANFPQHTMAHIDTLIESVVAFDKSC